MRKVLSFLIVSAIVGSAIVGLRAQSDAAKAVVGRWEGQRDAEGRVDNVVFVFRQGEKQLTGEALRNNEKFDDITEIAVTGKTVSFSTGGIDFTGTIDGKTMTVTAHFDNRDLWSLKLTRNDKL